MASGLFDTDFDSGEKPRVPCIRLSELASRIQTAIKQSLGNTKVWVEGEVRDLRYNLVKDHYYFKLVESKPGGDELIASFSAAIWSNNSTRVKNFERLTGQKFSDKLQVKVLCEVSFHQQYGLSLYVSDIDAYYTLGNLEASRQLVLDTLLSKVPGVVFENGQWQSPNKKLEVPRVIQHIALMTARNSDAFRDFDHELKNNNYGYQFKVTPYFIPVQGKGAELEIERAFKQIVNGGTHYDVIVLTRGGGGETDLLAFDSFIIGQVIAQCPIPVIAGIGHERNLSVADLMAKVSTKTPTRAGTYIIEWNHSFENAIQLYLQRILAKSQEKLHKKALELNSMQEKLSSLVNNKILAKRNEIERALITLNTNLQRHLQSKWHSLELINQKLVLMDPHSILTKGYVLVKRGGKFVTRASGLKSGEGINLVFQDGERKANIE